MVGEPSRRRGAERVARRRGIPLPRRTTAGESISRRRGSSQSFRQLPVINVK
jgi:hypothetical protein